MADSEVEGKGKKETGRYGVPEKITIDGSEGMPHPNASAAKNLQHNPQASISCPK